MVMTDRAATGLDYFGARYFSGAQGRFTSPDWSATPQPLPYADVTDPQTLNLYAYARNNPLSRYDLNGHCDSSSNATPNSKCQDPSALQLNDAGKKHIQTSEVKPENKGAPDLEVYLDTAQHPTAGYGHKITAADNLKVGDRVTQEQADTWFSENAAGAEKAVRSAVGKVQLSQGEFNALVDLVYNVGPGALARDKSPGLMKAIADSDYKAMAGQLMYSKDDAGNQQKGLVRRSEERRKIFEAK